jgi:hypothetical protein
MSGSKQVFVIDVQGVLLEDGFSAKEMAISDGVRIVHFIFKPTTPFRELSDAEKQQVRWLENNHHSLRYSDGHVNPDEIPAILRRFGVHRNHTVCYVKGHQKIDFLKKHLPPHSANIVNLEYYDVPNFIRTDMSCMYHFNRYSICSLINVKLLCKYLLLNKIVINAFSLFYLNKTT